MRTQILNLLKENNEQYISGEQLAEKLNVSRTAVWKHIQSLREQGYAIESIPRSGYRLMDIPDLLSPEEIKPLLHTKFIGQEIKYFSVTDSTNNQAKQFANQGAQDGTIVLSEEQTMGRGRLARAFFSPKGKGIWLSIILRPPFLPQEAPKCTLLAAVAVTKAIIKVTSVKVGIKWPNDILYNGKKLVGILTEMNAEMDCINYVILGIGLNVNLDDQDIPNDIKDIAISLKQITQKPVSRQHLLAAILTELENLYLIAQNQGFAPIFDEWRKYSITLNQDIKVIAPNETYFGKAIDIDEEGALLVSTEDNKIKKVLAGDVSIRPRS